jgi:hypothetical protein
MVNVINSVQKLQQFLRLLQGRKVSAYATPVCLHEMRRLSSSTFQIGGVRVPIMPIKESRPWMVPFTPQRFVGLLESQFGLRHVRFLAQKDGLGQHAMLMGSSHMGRLIVMRYAEMVGREVEVVTITGDTSESGLKQRREIVNGKTLFVDEAVVRCAVHGRYLVMDGVHRAEQSVLALLNSVLVRIDH